MTALTASEFFHDLFDRRQPLLQLCAPALRRHLLENRGRQKLTIRALEHCCDFLQLALETLSGWHELRDDVSQRLARDMIRAGEKRRPPGAADHPLDVRARQLPALRNRRNVLGRDAR